MSLILFPSAVTASSQQILLPSLALAQLSSASLVLRKSSSPSQNILIFWTSSKTFSALSCPSWPSSPFSSSLDYRPASSLCERIRTCGPAGLPLGRQPSRGEVSLTLSAFVSISCSGDSAGASVWFAIHCVTNSLTSGFNADDSGPNLTFNRSINVFNDTDL